jgi:hypothetical protein
MVPLARAEGGDVHSQRLALVLEVVGLQVVCAPPGGSQGEKS